jgi:hypothetical protein
VVCELGDGGAADRIEHERQLLPCQRSFQLRGKVILDNDDAVATCGNDLRGGGRAAYEIERLDTGELRELDDVLADRRIRACLSS